MERWKDVAGYDGAYQVSTEGRVKSIQRIDALNRFIPERIMSQAKTRGGYLSVTLYKNGKQKAYRVNRLVAMSFINNPNNYPYVGHNDDDIKNNNVNNLYWTTQKENMNHNNIRERLILSHSDMVEATDGISKLIFISSRDAERKGFNASAIRNCISGRSLTHKGYKWRRLGEVIKA